MSTRFVSMFLALVLLASPLVPVRADEPAADATATARLTGTIYGNDGKPLAGATVVAYHLSTETVFRSDPTGRDGSYSIDDVPYGYYDLGVETVAGLYVSDQVVNVPPAGKAVLSMTVGAESSGEPRAFPGSEQAPVGIAGVSRKLTGRDFWKSPKGVTIIAGSAGAALLLLASGGGGSSPEPVASPTAPPTTR